MPILFLVLALGCTTVRAALYPSPEIPAFDPYTGYGTVTVPLYWGQAEPEPEQVSEMRSLLKTICSYGFVVESRGKRGDRYHWDFSCIRPAPLE